MLRNVLPLSENPPLHNSLICPCYSFVLTANYINDYNISRPAFPYYASNGWNKGNDTIYNNIMTVFNHHQHLFLASVFTTSVVDAACMVVVLLPPPLVLIVGIFKSEGILLLILTLFYRVSYKVSKLLQIRLKNVF